MKIGYRNIGIIQAKTLMQQKKMTVLFPKKKTILLIQHILFFSFNFISLTLKKPDILRCRHLKVFLISFKKKTPRKDGWMICDFMSSSTVFQSYQDDERLIMKGCVQWSSFYG